MLSNKFNYDAYPQPLQLKLFLCKYRKKSVHRTPVMKEDTKKPLTEIKLKIIVMWANMQIGVLWI